MSDLIQDLRSRLASTYRIERELGGGGMSRVFLAEEIALGRRVVIKVFPPELAAVLSTDRFEQEVRMAAGLQHPHIVPLLAAGRAGDVLYYTMPFVEGESLRARLDRSGALPIVEAVRLFRETADALAYAHQRGFVHRDIKPENVLLSHRHAVVTDFGVAKALSDAAAGPSLTQTGVAVGTPAYMAPEQVAADPQADHRIDLYALGVLAYEMLAGQPPFHGATPQALVAAHLTLHPRPLAELRPAVSPELAAIVHRCLEKQAADRYQDAAELEAALDAAAASTGTDPRSTVAAGTSQRRATAAARPWSLRRVSALLGLATAAILAVAWSLRTLAGLPNWFFAAAVLLAVVEVIVVLVATIVHNRRLRARPGAPPPRPRAGYRQLTMHGAVIAGVVGFLGLGLVTGSWAGMRSMGIGPFGSLVASGQLAARERLIIADFASQTRDTLLGPAVTEAFRVDFSQSTLVSPLEADYVQRVLQRMGRSNLVAIEESVALEIAQREGIRAVVAGDLRQVGPSLLISARLVNAETAEVLASVRETARDSTRILDAVDRVSKKLRERIGESLRSTRANAPLPEVTTASLEALRRYAQAVRASAAGDAAQAITLLSEAVAADSSFAMAWRKLGTILYNRGEDPVRAAYAVTRAFDLRDHLTTRERRLTEGSYYSDVAARPDSAAEALELLLLEYPDDNWALNNLGVFHFFNGDLEKAAEVYARVTTLQPDDHVTWSNLLGVQIELGDFDAAAATLDSMKSRLPPGPVTDGYEVLFALGRRDFTTAEALLREHLERQRGDSGIQLQFMPLLAGVLTIRGKLAEAGRVLEAVAELRAARGLEGSALRERIRHAPPLALYTGDSAAARARFSQIVRQSPLEQMSERERPLANLINAAVAVGDAARARMLLQQMDTAAGSEPGRVRNFLRSYLRAQVFTLHEDSVGEAINTLRRSGDGPCPSCVALWMGRAFDGAGMPDSALVHYERWAATGESNWSGPSVYIIDQPVAYLRLAELYDAKGQRERAAHYYARLVELWRDADPVLQPRVREIERRLATLVAEPVR